MNEKTSILKDDGGETSDLLIMIVIVMFEIVFGLMYWLAPIVSLKMIYLQLHQQTVGT